MKAKKYILTLLLLLILYWSFGQSPSPTLPDPFEGEQFDPEKFIEGWEMLIAVMTWLWGLMAKYFNFKNRQLPIAVPVVFGGLFIAITVQAVSGIALVDAIGSVLVSTGLYSIAKNLLENWLTTPTTPTSPNLEEDGAIIKAIQTAPQTGSGSTVA